jgi:hypothetical protein
VKAEALAQMQSQTPPTTVFIDNPAELAALFANVVTTQSHVQDDLVARNGDLSIFSALLNIMPEVATSHNTL